MELAEAAELVTKGFADMNKEMSANAVLTVRDRAINKDEYQNPAIFLVNITWAKLTYVLDLRVVG